MPERFFKYKMMVISFKTLSQEITSCSGTFCAVFLGCHLELPARRNFNGPECKSETYSREKFCYILFLPHSKPLRNSHTIMSSLSLISYHPALTTNTDVFPRKYPWGHYSVLYCIVKLYLSLALLDLIP